MSDNKDLILQELRAQQRKFDDRMKELYASIGICTHAAKDYVEAMKEYTSVTTILGHLGHQSVPFENVV